MTESKQSFMLLPAHRNRTMKKLTGSRNRGAGKIPMSIYTDKKKPKDWHDARQTYLAYEHARLSSPKVWGHYRRQNTSFTYNAGTEIKDNFLML